MERFDIAGLKVDMECHSGLTYDRSRKYLSDKKDGEADIVVDLPEEFIREKHKSLPTLTLDECRYVWLGEYFYSKLLDFNGMLLHASCIEKDGRAYLFSAKSGTGKSTHTKLWMKHFKNVTMINDDKPAIRKIGDRFYACGTPFSGKNDESENLQVPIRAIVFLERSESNSIELITPNKAIALFMSQTIRPSRLENMDKMLTVLDKVLKEVPIFSLKCNMSPEAAEIAFRGIEKYYNTGDKDEN